VTYNTTPNLLISGVCGVWSNTACPKVNGGESGGNQPGYNPSTDTILFGYTQSTVGQVIAINNALSGTGIKVGGYDYSWKIDNSDYQRGTVTGVVTLKSNTGSTLGTWTYDYSNQKNLSFQQFSGTQWFSQDYLRQDLSSISLQWTGKDDRYWAGYYGPRVRDPSLSLRYITDLCSTNPLSNPDCPGYAEAYKTQQCSINPLYDASCPGYSTAYKTQQCSISALYDPSCPGYSAAYKTQQCSINPLYAIDCPGYETAYFNAQCLKDSLYSSKCEGYKTAYAIKYLVNLDPAVTTAVNQQLTTTVETYKADPANAVSSTNSTLTSASGETNAVNSPPPATSASGLLSVNPASGISVIKPPTPQAADPVSGAATKQTEPPKPNEQRQTEQRQEQKKTDSAVRGVERRSGGNRETARREALTQAKQIASEMSQAQSIEQQTAQQGLLVGLIGYVPGFAGYQSAFIPDTNSAAVARLYSKPPVDNRSAQRRMQGASDALHREMVEQQYIQER
jgi:hypothetical protein